MIQHMVLMKLKPLAPIDKINASARNNLTRIKGVVSASGGATFTTDRSAGFTYGLSVVLESKEALAEYAKDPIHGIHAFACSC